MIDNHLLVCRMLPDKKGEVHIDINMETRIIEIPLTFIENIFKDNPSYKTLVIDFAPGQLINSIIPQGSFIFKRNNISVTDRFQKIQKKWKGKNIKLLWTLSE